MFVMSANSFLLALDMFRSKCIFYSIYIFLVFALQQALGCGGQLPVYQGWYIANPLQPQVDYYSPSIRKVHHGPRDTLSFGPMCMVPPFLPYPYEIFHVQRIFHPSEEFPFPDQVPYEEIGHYEQPIYETVEVEGDEEEEEVIPYHPAGHAPAEVEDMRSTPYPDNYHLPTHVQNHHELAVMAATTDGEASEEVGYHPPVEQSESEQEPEVEPDIWAHYLQTLGYTPQYDTETPDNQEVVANEEVTEATEAPCHVEQTTVLDEVPESTPIPEVPVEEEPLASASAMSQHQQDLLTQMNEQYESEDEASPCDGYFERNAANLAHMLEQHFDHRHMRGSRSGGTDHPDTSRLFTPIIKALKNIFGSFMSMAEKPLESKDKTTEPEPVTTERPEALKQESTTKPAEVQTPTTQKPQDTQSVTTPEPESGATETPVPGAEKEARR